MTTETTLAKKTKVVVGPSEMFGEIVTKDPDADLCKQAFKEVSTLEKRWLADRKWLRKFGTEWDQL